MQNMIRYINLQPVTIFPSLVYSLVLMFSVNIDSSFLVIIDLSFKTSMVMYLTRLVDCLLFFFIMKAVEHL